MANTINIEDVWQEYRASLKGFLRSKLNNKDDVEDILQDVLIKFYNKIHTLNDQQSIKPWLFQIANNAVIDFYRQQSKQSALQQETLWFEQSETNIKAELSHCISPFLNMLNEHQAELLTAIDINGESQKAYAERMGLSYSTLKSQVQSARASLKSKFESCCNYEIDNRGNLMTFDKKSSDCKKC